MLRKGSHLGEVGMWKGAVPYDDEETLRDRRSPRHKMQYVVRIERLTALPTHQWER